MRARTRQLSGRSCGRLSRKSIRRRNRFPLTIRRPKHLCLPESWSARTAGILWLPPRETQRRKNGTVKHYTSYFCSRFATTGHSICSWHRIFEISLKNLVLSEIRAHGKAVAADEAAVLDKLKQHIQSASAAQQEDSRQEISRLRRRLEELEQITAKLYEDKVREAISGDSFSVLIQKNEQERIQKSERLDSLLAGERKAQQDIANIHQWAGTIRQYLDLQELNREIIEELIDRIEVGERTVIDGQRHQDIKIYYRFVGLV